MPELNQKQTHKKTDTRVKAMQILLKAGMTQQEIAEAMQLDRITIYRWIRQHGRET